ncbi:MAG: hypothetical protein LBE84_00465 [Planctomycetota bacterium]|nr:hypothetical protein [Planctomycetota bacterium]
MRLCGTLKLQACHDAPDRALAPAQIAPDARVHRQGERRRSLQEQPDLPQAAAHVRP